MNRTPCNPEPHESLTPTPPWRRAVARALLVAAAIAALVGCGTEDNRATWADEPLVASQPQIVGDRFAVIVQPLREIWLFEPGVSHVETSTIALDGTPVYSRTTATDELLVLTQNPDTLVVMPADAGAPEVRPVASAYDGIAVSDDARFVVLYFTAGSTGAPGRILFNPNEVTVIDRQSDTTRVFTLAGPRPSTISFAPEFALADPANPMHYAVVTGQSAVSFVDLTTDDDVDRQRLVRLSDPSTGRNLAPASVLFSTDDPGDPNDMTAYVLASGSDEIFAIDLLPADPATGRTLQPAINQITTTRSPSQMLRFTIDGVEKLLVTSGSSPELAVIDVPTGAVTRVPLDRALPRVLVWESVEDGAVRPRALFYRSGDPIVFFADLDAIERQGMGAMLARPLGSAVLDVTLAPGAGDTRAVARYSDQRGLSVLNLETRAETPIPSQVTLGSFALVGDFFFTVVPGTESLAFVDLTTGSPGELPLEATGEAVFAVPGRNALVVTHGGAAGWFSFYSLADLEAGPHTVSRAPYYEGLLDRRFDAPAEGE